MRFELCVLGSSAAVPANGRFCSAHVLSLEHADFLIDCGEGTQIRLQQAGIGPGRIGCILISHLHGDHYFGLPGLLTSLMLGGRTEELRIFSPPGLQERIRLLLDLDGFTPSFPLTFVEIEVNEPQQIWEDKEIEILAFPLRHRLPTNGYLVREKPRLPNLRKSAVENLRMPYQLIPGIKKGADYSTPDGQLVPNQELVYPAPNSRSFGYCSDTRYFSALADYVHGVDLLYHEATFLHEALEKAEKTMHSTALEAALTARDAQVKTLVIGHFSARYGAPHVLEEEARSVFPNTYAATDLGRYTVPFDNRKVDA